MSAATKTGPCLLEVRNLTTEILTPSGPRVVVDDLSFDVRAGEVLAIIGESGSGKSVAMRSLTGLIPQPPALVTKGSAHFEGRDLLKLAPAGMRAVRGNRIGMIFQEPMTALDPVMRVGDQIAETLVEHRGMNWRAARAEAVRLLDRVRIPDAAGRAGLVPDALSGGMRQRVVIAAALACKPSLVIADEPTTALDAHIQAEILGLLRELREEVGCAIILITHDMAVVRRAADRVLVMQSGKKVEEGTCTGIIERPRADYTKTLIAASLPSGTGANTMPAKTEAPDTLVVKDLVVSFPRSQGMASFRSPERLFAVDGVSLSIEPGETLALVGESGSGKTTLARAILGLTPVDDGRIWIDGADIAERPDAARGRVQYVFQDPHSSLNPRDRVWRTITEPLRLSGCRDDGVLRDTAVRLLEKVGLDASYLDRFPHQLSGGQRQRLGIARALSVSPSLVIADEAVSALDATTRLQVLDLIQDIQKETQLPFLFITHDFAVVARAAHRVAVMRFGRLVEIGPTASVLATPAHAYTRGLVLAAKGLAGERVPEAGHRVGVIGSKVDWTPLKQVAPGHFVEA